MTDRLVDTEGRVGMKLNAGKCKVMRMNNARREHKVKIGNEEVVWKTQNGLSIQAGTTLTKDGGSTEDFEKCQSKARGTFFNLMKIWKTQSVGRNTAKIKLFKTLVRPILLYGCKAWKITRIDLSLTERQCLFL